MKPGMNLAAAVAAAASACVVAASETIVVDWGMALGSGEEMIAVGLNGTILNTACNSKLKLGNVEVKVDADEDARGTLTITPSSGKMDPREYDLDDEDFCDAFWTKDAAQIECSIPWEAEYEEEDEDALVRSPSLESMNSCFSSTPNKSQRPLPLGEDLSDMLDGNDTEWMDYKDDDSNAPSKRQGSAGLCSSPPFSREADPLNARKWRRYGQVTTSMDCGVLDCSAGYTESVSVSLAASVSANLGEWITAGFSVTKSESYGESFTCTGKPHDWICVKHMARFQGYDVEWVQKTGCGTQEDVKTVTVRSPLKKDEEEHFYCARGKHACKDEDNSFWDDRGPGKHEGA